MGSFTKKATAAWDSWNEQHYIKWDKRKYYDLSTFSGVLVAEYALRESVQRMEMLQHKIRSLEKAAGIEPKGKVQLEEANSELDRGRIQFYRNQQALYRAEVMLPPCVKEDYDKLRSDEDWYMREEMAQDCADKGGCCSRGCGCCARRKLSEKGKGTGTGHCTTECWCCSDQRGFELPYEDKQAVRLKYNEMLRDSNRVFLQHSINCFVSPLKAKPRPQVEVPAASNSASKWRRLFKLV